MSRVFIAKRSVRTFTDWIEFLSSITAAGEGYVASLIGLDNAIIGQARKNANGKIELCSRFNLRLADSTQLNAMLTAIGTASAHTPQTPHVSTGGTILANNGSIGLNNLEFIGAKKNLRAGFVIDTNAAVLDKMFGVGARDKSLADTTSLELGGLFRSNAGTVSSIYARDNINTPTSVTLSAITGTLANGVVVEAIHTLLKVGNQITPDDRGSYIRGAVHSAQTAGGLVASSNNTVQQTNNTSNDLQITFTNTWNLTSVIRLIWFEAFGMEAIQV